MNTITHNQRYLPHELSTKYYAVKLYMSGCPVSFVCRIYKISKSSLMRWNKKFDDTKESLMNKSHKHKPYYTSTMIGIKRQMNVKFAPRTCHTKYAQL